MEPQYKTNEALATAYLHVAARVFYGIDAYRKAIRNATLIRESPLDLPAYFKENKTLTNLALPEFNLGKPTLEFLTNLLVLGEDAVIRDEAKRVRKDEMTS